jgi:predicted dehydrogenase
MFVAEMEHFIQVCRGEAEPLCPLSDGVASLQLALAAEQAANGSVSTAISQQNLTVDGK